MTTVDVQRIIKVKGFCDVEAFQKSAGLLADGIVGPKTRSALSLIPKKGMLAFSQVRKKFGAPGDPANLTIITLPYPQRIAWLLNQSITKMQVHKDTAERFVLIYKELLEVYGLEQLKLLGIDLYGGCYVFRPKRGNEKKYYNALARGDKAYAETLLSNHSWGTAVDHDPSRNTLYERANTARFARPEYIPMMLIFYKHGFCNQGIELGFDFMHFESL